MSRYKSYLTMSKMRGGGSRPLLDNVQKKDVFLCLPSGKGLGHLERLRARPGALRERLGSLSEIFGPLNEMQGILRERQGPLRERPCHSDIG